MPARPYLAILLGLYFLLGLLNLAGQVWGLSVLSFWSKPFLMPVLGLYFWLGMTPVRPRWSFWVLLALFFSTGGDISLLFAHQSGLFFMLGLGSFLLGHLAYLGAYSGSVQDLGKSPLLRRKPHAITPFLVYSMGLYAWLWPHLGPMQWPVFAYTGVIITMALLALNRWGRTCFPSFYLCFGGALLFLISDSLIALDRFVGLIPGGGFFVMLTYILAQFGIVQGLLVHTYLQNSQEGVFRTN